MKLDGWSIAGIVFLVAIAAWGIRLLKQRLADQRYQQELADLEFEGSVFSEIGPVADFGHDQHFVSQPVEHAGLHQEQRPQELNNQTPQVVPPGPLAQPGMSSADEAASHVMQQLQNSGLLKSVEGYIDVHGNPKGAAILLLRDGKRALLVPHMESEVFLRRHSKRVEMIIMAGSDGKGVVITPLEELISQNLVPR
jgi:hypothetical protein